MAFTAVTPTLFLLMVALFTTGYGGYGGYGRRMERRDADVDRDALSDLVDGLKDKPSAEFKARVLRTLGDYLCAIDDPQCDGEMALQIEAELVQDGVDCDETPYHDLCVTARELVNPDGSLSDEDLKSALVLLAAESLENDPDYISLLDQISVDLNALICQREPEECEFWR